MDKRQRIVEILTVFSEAFRESLSEDYMQRYIRLLEVYPLEKIEQAADRIFARNKFHKFPLPAEFLGYLDPPEQAQIKSNEAWRTVLRAVRMHGYYTTVKFTDPAITETILGMSSSWPEFSNRICCDDPEFKWLQKEFEERYAAYAKMGALRNQVLIGWCDHENGEENPVPVLIGTLERELITEQKAPQRLIDEAKGVSGE